MGRNIRPNNLLPLNNINLIQDRRKSQGERETGIVSGAAQGQTDWTVCSLRSLWLLQWTRTILPLGKHVPAEARNSNPLNSTCTCCIIHLNLVLPLTPGYRSDVFRHNIFIFSSSASCMLRVPPTSSIFVRMTGIELAHIWNIIEHRELLFRKVTYSRYDYPQRFQNKFSFERLPQQLVLKYHRSLVLLFGAKRFIWHSCERRVKLQLSVSMGLDIWKGEGTLQFLQTNGSSVSKIQYHHVLVVVLIICSTPSEILEFSHFQEKIWRSLK